MNALEGISETFTSEEKAEAASVQKDIELITKTILQEKQSLESNFVKLSQKIDLVRRKKYWLLGDFKNFGEYIEDCETRFGLKHSQLYVGMKVTRNLLPSVPENELVDMGISKAGVLSKYVEQSGQRSIPEEIMVTARDPKKTREELDAQVNSRLHNVSPQKGKWFSLGGFFCSEDEKKEIEDAWELAAAIDPVISNAIPDWMQLKEKQLRLAREFFSSYAGG